MPVRDRRAAFVSVFAIGFVGLPTRGAASGAAIVADNERRAGRFIELAPPERRVVIHAGTLAGARRERTLSSRLRLRGGTPVRADAHRVRWRPAAPARSPASRCAGSCRATSAPSTDPHRRLLRPLGRGHRDIRGFLRITCTPTRTFDPALWWVAQDGDRLAGYVGARLSGDDDPELGYVGLLGVLAPYRRRGIGEALLRRTFRALHDRGQKGCELHVDADSPTGATRLYERVGMTAHPRFVTWEKELRPGT